MYFSIFKCREEEDLGIKKVMEASTQGVQHDTVHLLHWLRNSLTRNLRAIKRLGMKKNKETKGSKMQVKFYNRWRMWENKFMSTFFLTLKLKSNWKSFTHLIYLRTYSIATSYIGWTAFWSPLVQPASHYIIPNNISYPTDSAGCWPVWLGDAIVLGTRVDKQPFENWKLFK